MMMTMRESEPNPPKEATFETTETRSASQPSSKQLLSKVLVETLSRRREDSDGLIDHLRQWRSMLADQVLSQAMLAAIVGQVLLYRLGPDAENIPENLRQEVGEVLWNDPASQTRLNRLWSNLESQT
jgi:hypothetical protein